MVGCHHAENGPIHRKMVVDYPLVIKFKMKPFSRPDQTRKEESLAKPVFCIVDIGSCCRVNQVYDDDDDDCGKY